MHWSPVPLDTLLDVEAIIGRWAARGTVVHRTPALAPFPDLTQPEAAFPAYPLDGLDPALMVRCALAGSVRRQLFAPAGWAASTSRTCRCPS